MIQNIQAIAAVLFDLDGVVVSSDEYHYRAWKRLADEEGWQFDEVVNRKLRGISRLGSLQAILDHNGIDDLTDEEKVAFASRKNGYYVASLQRIDERALLDGAVDLLAALQQRGVRMALCSASRNAMLILDNLNLTRFFDAVVTGADVSRSKPDPEIFLLAAQRLGVLPGQCIVFEDAAAGIDAAQAAGMRHVGVGPIDRLPNAYQIVEDYAAIDIDHLIATGFISEAVCRY